MMGDRVVVLGDVAFEDRPGGSERLIQLVVSALARRGERLEVVAGSPRGSLGWEEGGVRQRRFPVRMSRNTLLCWDAWRGARKWGAEVGQRKVIGIHPSSSFGCIAGSGGRASVAQFFFAPTYREWLWQARSRPTHLALRFPVAWGLREVQKRSLAGSRVIMVLGDHSREVLRREFPAVAEAVVVPPAVEVERFPFAGDVSAARQTLGLSVDEVILLAVRRLVPRTGVLRLVEAFGMLRPPNARLLVAGEGPQRDDIARRVDALDLDGSVKLLGRVSDDELPVYYRAADLSVVPSVGLEAFGLVVLESLACGTPVAVTPVGELPHMVADVDARLVFSGSSSAEIASGLERVISRDLLRGLRPRCRRLVESEYSLARFGERLTDVLRRM
jgi:glycosyltransferase involved in cell wall biosynthesis